MRIEGKLALLILGLVVVCAPGCIVGPDHMTPYAEIPEVWEPAQEDETVTQDWSELADWWVLFEDDLLNQLMDEAVSQNLTVEEAAYRVLEARFQRGIVRGELFPNSTAQGGYTFQKTATSGGIFGQLGGLPAFDVTIDQWNLGLNNTWEIDVFGRLRRGVEAAEADVCASIWDYRDTLIIMMADVASNYVDARTNQERLETAYRNLENQKESLANVEAKFPLVTTKLEVEQAKAIVRTTEATIPTLEANYRVAINRLSVLLGRPPGYVNDLMMIKGDIPAPAEEIAVGIPADLLRRRPDIRRAERQLAAQTARIGVAVGDLYPQISIFGNFGVNAQDFSELFTWNSVQATAGPSVQWNILSFGRIRYNIRVQETRASQNVLRYKSTVLTAAEEVDNSLISYVKEKERLAALQSAAESYREVVRLAELRFSGITNDGGAGSGRGDGITDYQPVLDARRELFQIEDQIAISRGTLSRNLIQLYRALGGGWEIYAGTDAIGCDLPRYPPSGTSFMPRCAWSTPIASVQEEYYDGGEPIYEPVPANGEIQGPMEYGPSIQPSQPSVEQSNIDLQSGIEPIRAAKPVGKTAVRYEPVTAETNSAVNSVVTTESKETVQAQRPKRRIAGSREFAGASLGGIILPQANSNGTQTDNGK